MTDVIRVQTDTQAAILEDPSKVSLKRIAWAYGCAKKGSDAEAALLPILIAKAREHK